MDPQTLESLFKRAIKTYKFFPKVSEILAPLETVKQAALPEKAALKWDEVRGNIRLHYHPDLGGWRGPKISERTRRAINAAGGMAYLSECVGDDLVFARKRFMESYLRWEELKQDEYLLPDGEVKKLLSEAAEKICVTHLLEAK